MPFVMPAMRAGQERAQVSFICCVCPAGVHQVWPCILLLLSAGRLSLSLAVWPKLEPSLPKGSNKKVDVLWVWWDVGFWVTQALLKILSLTFLSGSPKALFFLSPIFPLGPTSAHIIQPHLPICLASVIIAPALLWCSWRIISCLFVWVLQSHSESWIESPWCWTEG